MCSLRPNSGYHLWGANLCLPLLKIYFLYLLDREVSRCRVWEQKKSRMCPDVKVEIKSNKKEKLGKVIFFVIDFSLDHPCFYNSV